MMSSHGYRKGQYFSFDAIIASVIFVLTLVMLLSYWHSVRAYLDYQANDLSKEASRVSGVLFTPASGECSKDTLTKLGLASSWNDKRINAAQLECAAKLDAGQVKSKLGSSYFVSIVVKDLYLDRSYSIGPEPTPDFLKSKVEVSKISRIGAIATSSADHLATVDVYVYR